VPTFVRALFPITAFLIVPMLPCAAVAQDDIRSPEAEVNIRVLDPEEHLLRLIRETLPGKHRTELVAEFHRRFPASSSRDEVCEAEMQGKPEPSGTPEILAAAESLLAKNCLVVRACNWALSVPAENSTADSRLLWARKCHGIATQESPETVAGSAEAVKALRKQAEYQIFTLSWNARGVAAQRYLDELRALNPQSEYVVALYERALHEALAANDMQRLQVVANRCLQANPENVAALLALANAAIHTRHGLDQVVPLTTRAMALLNREAATPEGTGERQLALRRQKGQALWIQGTYFASQRRWKEADTVLRQSLPLVEETQSMLASALYHLGLANSQLDRHSESLKEIRDAVQFLERCVAISSQHKAEAARLLAMLKPLAQH
jgi:tetratricopeptide (TPR) repeat protein